MQWSWIETEIEFIPINGTQRGYKNSGLKPTHLTSVFSPHGTTMSIGKIPMLDRLVSSHPYKKWQNTHFMDSFNWDSGTWESINVFLHSFLYSTFIFTVKHFIVHSYQVYMVTCGDDMLNISLEFQHLLPIYLLHLRFLFLFRFIWYWCSYTFRFFIQNYPLLKEFLLTSFSFISDNHQSKNFKKD